MKDLPLKTMCEISFLNSATFPKPGDDFVLAVLQKTQHPKITSAKEVFKDHGMTYFIVDDFPLTLEHVVACDIFPSELQLASILVQVWKPQIKL